jgi:hypothetical protein
MYVKNLIFAILLCIVPSLVKAQTYVYSYADPCTGNIKTINVPSNGVTVTYFGQMNTFSPADFNNGTFNNWASSVYSSFGGNNPCGSTVGVTSTVSMAQNSAINTLNILGSLSAISDIASSMGAGGALNTNGVIESSKTEAKSNDKKSDKKNSDNSSTSGSTPNGGSTTSGSTSGSSGPGTESGSTGSGSGNGSSGTVSNIESSGGSTTSGSTTGSSGSGTESGSTNSGGSRTGSTSETSTETSGTSGGYESGATSGGSSTGSEGTGSGSTTESGTGSEGTTTETGSTESSTTETGSTESASGSEVTTTESTGVGNTGTESSTTSGSGTSSGSGSNPNSNNSTEAGATDEKKSSNVLGGSVGSIQNSSGTSTGGSKSGGNPTTKGGAPTIVLSSDFAGFNFKSGETTYGGKGTAGWTSLNWDGTRSHGFMLDYTSANRGPNFTAFYASIKKRRINLISLTGTTSFYGKGSLYGTVALGQMWTFPKVKNLKAIYMATSSVGNVFGTKFIGTAFIAGGMYDLVLGKRTQIKFTNLFIYAPYISYYNDMVLKSPYVIMPIIGTNIGITKKFKLNVNFGGTYAIGEDVLNFTLMMGTRFVL